jgi:hypothetical protein
MSVLKSSETIFHTYNAVYGILRFLAVQGLVDCKCPGQHSDGQQLIQQAR